MIKRIDIPNFGSFRNFAWRNLPLACLYTPIEAVTCDKKSLDILPKGYPIHSG